MAVDFGETRESQTTNRSADQSSSTAPFPGGRNGNFSAANSVSGKKPSSRQPSKFDSLNTPSSFVVNQIDSDFSHNPMAWSHLSHQWNTGTFESYRAQTVDSSFMPSVSSLHFSNPAGKIQNPSRPRFVKVKRKSAPQEGNTSALGDSGTRVDDEKIGAALGDSLGLNSLPASQHPERNGRSFVKSGEFVGLFGSDASRVELGVGPDRFRGFESSGRPEIGHRIGGFSLSGNRNDEKPGGSSSSRVDNCKQVKGLRECVSGWNPFSSSLGNDLNVRFSSISSQRGVFKSAFGVDSRHSWTRNQSSPRFAGFPVLKEFRKLNIDGVGSIGTPVDSDDGILEVDNNDQTVKEPHCNVADFFTFSAGNKQNSVDADVSKDKAFVFGSYGEKMSTDHCKSTIDTNENTDNVLPIEMRKLKLEEMHEAGSSAALTSEAASKLNSTVGGVSENEHFVFGRSGGKTRSSGKANGSASENAYNMLPNQMRKLKIEEPAFTFKAGSRLNKSAGEASQNECFVFGNNREKARNSCEDSGSVREPSKENIVLDEMRNLKIEGTQEGSLKDSKSGAFSIGSIPQTGVAFKASDDGGVSFSGTVGSSAVFTFGNSHAAQETNSVSEDEKTGPSNESSIGRADLNTTRQTVRSENGIGRKPFIDSVDGLNERFKALISEHKAGVRSADGSFEQNGFSMGSGGTKASYPCSTIWDEGSTFQKETNAGNTNGSNDNSHHDFHGKSTPTVLDEFKESTTQSRLQNQSDAHTSESMPVPNEHRAFSCNIQDCSGKVNETGFTFAWNAFFDNTFAVGSDACASHLRENLVSELPHEMRNLKLDSRLEDSIFLNDGFHGSTTSRRSGNINNYPYKGKNARRSTRAAKIDKTCRPPSNEHGSHLDDGMKEKGVSSSRYVGIDVDSFNVLKSSRDTLQPETSPPVFWFGSRSVMEPDCDVQPGEDFRPSTSGKASSSSTVSEIPIDAVGSCSGSKDARADARASKVDNASLLKDFLRDFSENPFTIMDKLFSFNAKGGRSKTSKPKKKLGRLKQGATDRSRHHHSSFLQETNSQEKSELDSPGSYSPMDFSPYRETSPGGGYSWAASVTSDESAGADVEYVVKDSSHASTTEGLDVKVHGVADLCGNDGKTQGDWKPTAQISVAENVNRYSNQSKIGHEDSLSDGTGIWCTSSDVNVADSRATNEFLSSRMASLNVESGGSIFSGDVSKLDGGDPEKYEASNFTFAASSAPRTSFSAVKGNPRRKYRMRTDHGSTSSAESQKESPSVNNPVTGGTLGQAPGSDKVSLVTEHSREPGSKSLNQNSFMDKSVKLESKAPSSGIIGESRGSKISTPATSYANGQLKPTQNVAAEILEACEKWRLRGNQAYGKGDFSKAEEYYTCGLSMVSESETSKSCTRSLLLCYSNRAAARLTLGRVGEALMDCMEAIAIDPSFPRVLLRAANCYLALGHTADALTHYKKCMEYKSNSNVDQKVLREASNGLQKAQQLGDYMNQASNLLQQKTSVAAANALQVIEDALSLSTYSDHLMKMKAEALLVLRKYEEVIQLCEQTLSSAERNSTFPSSNDKYEHDERIELEKSAVRIWRWCMISRCYFLLGRLEDALDFFLKHEIEDSDIHKHSIKMSESSVAFPTVIRELLRLKSAGNEAFQAGKHAEAIEYYSAALGYNVESQPFAAICFCNRGAAYQGLNQITDAIADCSLAMALDANYAKAVSRRATLHETIRDYGQASNDLQRLMSLLQRQIENAPNETGAIGRPGSVLNDLRQAQRRLAAVQEEAKNEHPLNIYLILGIDPLCTASEAKKAYRKAALKHHPDKAGQFLARNENGDDGLWKEVAAEVHKDADRLFKMIGEAYAIASDPNKRLQFDSEENMRKVQKKGSASSPSQRSPASHNYHPFDERSTRKSRRDARTYYQWSEPYW